MVDAALQLWQDAMVVVAVDLEREDAGAVTLSFRHCYWRHPHHFLLLLSSVADSIPTTRPYWRPFSVSASRSEDHTRCRGCEPRPDPDATRGSRLGCSCGNGLEVPLSVGLVSRFW